LNKPLIFIPFLLCSVAFGQGNFSGPGVLSRGGGTVGQRSGQDVDLRYFVNATGIYDTGLTPYAVSSNGKLVQPGPQFGVEAGVGGYGRHVFRRSTLALDYTGNFRHYLTASNFDGSNQRLSLDYTLQKSRRLSFDFNESAGTQNFGTAFGPTGVGEAPVDASLLLFDNRTSYFQTTMNSRYAVSGRTTFQMGGSYYEVHRQSSALVGVKGYNLTGTIQHRVSRSSMIGANYQHTHYDFPRAFGEANIDMYSGIWSTAFGRGWSLEMGGGAFTSKVEGVESTALDPTIAALLGISSVQTIYYRESLIPMGQAMLRKQSRRAAWSANFKRTVSPGNGVYLTSLSQSYGSSYSYTGVRRLSMTIDGSVSSLSTLGQNLQDYRWYGATASLGYNIGAGFNLNATYTRRYQDIQAQTFQRDSSRISFGIYFSPGSVPISLH
jgi:hypothetical protein